MRRRNEREGDERSQPLRLKLHASSAVNIPAMSWRMPRQAVRSYDPCAKHIATAGALKLCPGRHNISLPLHTYAEMLLALKDRVGDVLGREASALSAPFAQESAPLADEFVPDEAQEPCKDKRSTTTAGRDLRTASKRRANKTETIDPVGRATASALTTHDPSHRNLGRHPLLRVIPRMYHAGQPHGQK